MRTKNAHTLIEIIFVMAILAVLFSLTIPLFNKKNSSPRQTAQKLASSLQLARQYAIEHGTFARLVFANAELRAHTTNTLSNAYGLYVFYAPRSDSTNFSAEYVGRWIPLPCELEWQHLENVNIPFTNGANNESALKTLYYNPQQYWAVYETNCFATNYGGSFYPTNFFQTPYPTSYPIAEQTNADGNVEKRFQINGTPNFFNLRGVEFNFQGKPTFSDTNNLIIRIIDSQNTNNYYDVVVDRMNGMIQARAR